MADHNVESGTSLVGLLVVFICVINTIDNGSAKLLRLLALVVVTLS